MSKARNGCSVSCHLLKPRARHFLQSLRLRRDRSHISVTTKQQFVPPYTSFYKQGSLLFRKDFNYCRTTARGLLSPIQNCTDTEGLSSLCLKATHLYRVISLVCTSIPHSLPEAKTAECCKEEPLRSHQCYKTYHSFTTLLRIINNQMELLEFPNFISNGPYQRHKLYCSVHFSPTEQIGWHLLATGKHQKQPFFSIK